MSISAYVGLPGHGKSYGAVENVILPALKQGRVVFTNIPMDEELLKKDFGGSPVFFTTDEVIQNPNWFSEVFQAGAILVFDELWKLWPSGLKATNALVQHQEFLAQHRHLVSDDGYSTEIYFITQDLSQISNFARVLVETTYRMVKRISIGFDKRFRVDIYEGAVTGVKPPVSKRIRELHGGKFDKKIYQYYKSHTKSDLVGNESRTDKRNNALFRTSTLLGFGLFIFLCFVIYFGAKSFFSGWSKNEVESNSTVPASPVSAPVSSVLVSVPERKKTIEFLSKSKNIFYSHTIKTNNITDQFFAIEFDDSYAVLSARDLVKLGYKVLPFSSCVFLVEGQDYNDYVMCRSSRKTAGFIKSAISGEDS